MTENTDLLKRREELKLALREEATKTLVDVILEGVTRPIKKRGGTNRTLLAVYGTLIIYLITTLAGLLLVELLGEFRILQQIILRFGWWVIPLLITSTISMTIANASIHRIIAIFRDYILEIAETVETLNDIENWVNSIYSKKLALIAGAAGGIVSGAALVFNLNIIIGFPIGVGLTVMVILFAMQSSLFVGFLFAILFLTIRMHQYRLALFSSDPGNSQIIGILSGFLSNFVYLFACYGAFITYGMIATGLLIAVYSALPIFWGLIVLIFVINQYSLAQIIQRAKWKTLNATQMQIEKIQKAQAVPDKEQRETLIWLLDYHNRVKATRNSALNLEAGLSLFNSLLLPVLAFALGNLDTVIAFFR
jgi:hypothetical protein